MKSYFYYFSLLVLLTMLWALICHWLQIDKEFKQYILGIMVGYIMCAAWNRERIEACNKLISEIRKIVPKL